MLRDDVLEFLLECLLCFGDESLELRAALSSDDRVGRTKTVEPLDTGVLGLGGIGGATLRWGGSEA